MPCEAAGESDAGESGESVDAVPASADGAGMDDEAGSAAAFEAAAGCAVESDAAGAEAGSDVAAGTEEPAGC